MAVLTKAVLGTPKQKIGQVCFSTWRGKAVIKSLPSSVSNPGTDAQTSVRLRFTLLVKMTSPLSDVIAYGFKDQGTYGLYALDPLNAFVSYNYKNDCFNGQGPDQWTINFDKILISKGGLTGFTDHNLAMEGLNTVFTWTSDESADANDDVYCVMYNQALNLAKFTTAKRSAGTATMPIRENWLTAGPTYCFIFAYNGKKSSNSIYLDSLE